MSPRLLRRKICAQAPETRGGRLAETWVYSSLLALVVAHSMPDIAIDLTAIRLIASASPVAEKRLGRWAAATPAREAPAATNPLPNPEHRSQPPHDDSDPKPKPQPRPSNPRPTPGVS